MSLSNATEQDLAPFQTNRDRKMQTLNQLIEKEYRNNLSFFARRQNTTASLVYSWKEQERIVNNNTLYSRKTRVRNCKEYSNFITVGEYIRKYYNGNGSVFAMSQNRDPSAGSRWRRTGYIISNGYMYSPRRRLSGLTAA